MFQEHFNSRKRNTGLENVQKTTKNNRDLENVTYENRLKDLALFRLENRSLREYRVMIIMYAQGCYEEKVINYPLCMMD